MTNLARKLGLARGAYISQLLTDPPVRSVSEKTARSWEAKLGLPKGWMDGGTHATPVGPGVDAKLLAEVLQGVNEALRVAKVTLPAQQLADLVAMLYSDAQVAGKMDHGRLAMIVGLLRR